MEENRQHIECGGGGAQEPGRTKQGRQGRVSQLRQTREPEFEFEYRKRFEGFAYGGVHVRCRFALVRQILQGYIAKYEFVPVPRVPVSEPN